MSGWPSLEHVDDRLLAQQLRTGDPNALTQVCDVYAARLFDYTHALLRDQESATQTLHDAFLAAQAHVGGLRDPELFRGWLYALVRTECLRRLADPARPTGGQEAPEIEEQILDPHAKARQEETRLLVQSALSGLNGKQREAIDLVLRHHLAPEELAGVLGLSTDQATELAWESRERLDDALAAAVLVRGGRSECPSLSALVDVREWPLASATCRKLIRHLESCPVCGGQRRAKASTPELLRVLEVLPVAALPADLQRRVLITARDPALAGRREAIARAAEPLDEWGWPTIVEPPSRRGGRERDPDSRPKMWPAIAAACGVILIVGVVYLILPSSSNSKPSASTSQAAPSDSAEVSPDPSESIDESAPPTPTKTPKHSPSPSATPTATHTPTPKATPTKTKTPPKPPVPAKGTLQVVASSCAGVEANKSSCQITVTAVGGDVANWSATGSGGVTASGGGSIKMGQQRPVNVSFVRAADCAPGDTGQGSVTFSPSGGPASVSWKC